MAERPLQKQEKTVAEKFPAELLLKAYKTLIDKSAEGLAIFDKKGNILEFNKNLENITGIKKENAIGESILSIYPEIGTEFKDGIPVENKLFEDLAKISKGEFDFREGLKERRIKTPYGNEKFILYNYFTVSDGRGELILCIVKDITENKNSQYALMESEIKFSTLFNESPDLILIVESDSGLILKANKNISDFLGYSQSGIVGESINSIISEDSPEFPEILEKVKISGDYSCNAGFIKKSGKIIHFEMNAGEIKWGYRNAIMLSLRDSLNMTTVRESILQSEKRYKIISKLVSDYVYSFKLNQKGELDLEWVTSAFTDATGYKAGELGPDFLSQLIHPDDLPLMTKRIENLVLGKADVSEVRIIHKSGTVKYILDFCQPEMDENNKIKRVIGAGQDITIRKMTELALKESDKRLRVLLNDLPAGTYTTNIEGDILSANPAFAKILGYSGIKDLVKKNMSDIFENIKDREKKLRLLINSSNLIVEEYNFRKQNGEIVRIRDHARPYFDDNGSLSRIEGIVEDINENQKLKDTLNSLLEAAESMKFISSAKKAYRSVFTLIEKIIKADVFVIARKDTVAMNIKYLLYAVKGEENTDIQFIEKSPDKYGKSLGEFLLKKAGKLSLTREEIQSMADENIIRFKDEIPLCWIGIPIKDSNSKAIGFLNLQFFDENASFDDSTEDILLFFADLLGLFIEKEKINDAYHRLMHNSVQAIMIIRKRKVVYANKAVQNITGQRVSKLLNKNLKSIIKLMHPGDREKAKNIYETVLKTRDSEKSLVRIFNKYGKEITVEFTASLVDYYNYPAVQVTFIEKSAD